MLTLLARNAIPRRAAIVAGGLLVLVVITGTAIALWLFRSAALATAEWHLKNVAVVLAEQTRQGVLTVDMALRVTAHDYLERETGVHPQSDEAMHGRMRERVAELAQLRSLLVIRPDGDLGVHSNVFPAPEMNFRDRDYFTVHGDGKGPPLFFGVPVKGRVMGAHLVHTLSRRMEDAQGEFLGVVIAGIDVRYLYDIYRSLDLGPAGRVFLFRKDSVLLTSLPADDAEIGGSFPAHALFSSALPRAASGVLQARGLLDDHPRLIAYHSLQNYPLVVAVSSTTDYVLREWRKQSLYAAIGALGAAGVILLATFLFARQLRVSEELAGEVAESERRWIAAMEAADHGVWDWDLQSGKTFRSPQYHAILGYANDDIPASPEGWLRLLHPEDRELSNDVIQACLNGATRTFSVELRLRCKDGSWKWALNRGMVVSRDENGKALRMLGTITDVTGHRHAQQELRELYTAMHEVREAERTRIARELHDELAQWLTALKMDVSWIAARLPKDLDLLVDRAAKIKGVVDTTVAAVRRIAADLRPVMLDDLGVVPAVESLLHEFSQRTGIVIGFNVDCDGMEFKEPLATAVYRMVQEALTNVVRHAQASEVEVAIRLDGDRLVVRVCDNGRGIDAALPRKAKSYGLLGIRERAQTLGGAASIFSPAEGGTVVEIVIPVASYRSVKAET